MVTHILLVLSAGGNEDIEREEDTAGSRPKGRKTAPVTFTEVFAVLGVSSDCFFNSGHC